MIRHQLKKIIESRGESDEKKIATIFHTLKKEGQ